MKKSLIALTLVFVLLATSLLSACSGGKETKKDELVLGFVPLIEQEKLIESVQPLADILTKAIGTKVKAFTAANYVGVVEALGSGQVDFAIIPPFAYVLAHKENGAEVLLTALNKKGQKSYRSEILVRADSDIKDVKDIKGKRVAFVDPSSSSGYIYPAAFLKLAGLDLDTDIKSIFAGGHDAAVQSLLTGDVDVACTYEGARLKLEKDYPDIMQKTRVLTYTEPIPYIAVVVRKDLPQATKDAIKNGVMKSLNEGEGKELTAKLFNLYGFAEATDKDYDPIRKVASVMDIKVDD